MYCSNCGKQIHDGAKFCNFCGSPQKIINQGAVPMNNASQPSYVTPQVSSASREQLVDGKVHKCPFCGEYIPFDAIKCPSCHNEIRDKQSLDSINELVYRVRTESDLKRRIELIQLYPIPNSREAIFEFMIVATSQFDPEIYAGNPAPDSIPGAWLSQINLCYRKGKVLLTDPADIAKIEELYRSINGKEGSIAKEKNRRFIMLIIGIVCLVLGTVVLMVMHYAGITDPNSNQYSMFVSSIPMLIIVLGILALTVGRKRKKTNADIQRERNIKIAREKAKLDAERAKLDAIERENRY